MVDRMIAEGALWSPALVEAFRATPRHHFLDRVFVFLRKHNRWRETLTRDPEPDQLGLLYSDRALITSLSPRRGPEPVVPISSSSQPSLMAQMLEDLQVERGQRVLEVGTGTGYNAALLAHVAGPEHVVSVDVDRDVLSRAWDHLRRYAERGVLLEHGDGRAGFPARAPYDRIMVTAAAVDLEPAWLEQLAPGGLIVAPLVFTPGLEFIVRGTVANGVFEGRLTRAAYFMPLRTEGDFGVAIPELPPGVDSPLQIPAPWADWFERRRARSSWLAFSHSLAFLGLLLGCRVHYRSADTGTCFGISQGTTWCWLGQAEWQASDDAGRDLGWRVWQRFLDLGGPWPTEYRLQANPRGGLAAGENVFLRQGPRCQQRWEVVMEKERAGWI
jgi:protein-L-isoaspartate(D-aspartate) O-methyltransferase